MRFRITLEVDKKSGDVILPVNHQYALSNKVSFTLSFFSVELTESFVFGLFSDREFSLGDNKEMAQEDSGGMGLKILSSPKKKGE